MADTKISALSAGTAFAGTEEIPGVQSANTVKFTPAQIRNYVLATPVAVVGNATAGAEIRLPEDTDNGSNYVAIKAPDNLGATYTLTLPLDDGGSGEVLSTNGSGVLSWISAPGATAPLTLAGGTVTDPSTPLSVTQTWNDAADTFTGFAVTMTDTNSAAGSRLFDVKVGASDRVAANKNGALLVSNGTRSVWMRPQTVNLTATLTFADNYTSNNLLRTVSASHICGSGWGASEGQFDNYIISDANTGIQVGATRAIGFAAGTTLGFSDPFDASLRRIASGSLGVRGSSSSVGAALNLLEQTAPAAPSTNEVVIYAEDNGSGKTRLMARFATGAAQQIAIEP